MIILGIDPGSRVTGYGVIRSDKRQHEYIASGVIRVAEDELAAKLLTIFSGIDEIIRTYSPAEAAIERVFMAHNADSALKLGQARGAAIVAAAGQKITMAEYTARQVKQSVVGYGAADKAQVQQMVMSILRLNKKPPSDAADALAVALCHSHTRESLVHLAGVKGIRHGRLR